MRMKALKTVKLIERRKLVLIEWVDAHHLNSTWTEMDRLVALAGPLYCRSVGWLVAEGNGYKVLVAHISGEANEGADIHGHGDQAIPESCIQRIVVLKEA